MVLHVSEQAERIIRSLIERGRYASEGEVVDDALRQLVGHSEAPSEVNSPMTDDQDLQRRLVAAGLLGEIKPPITDFTPWEGREAVPVEGEPLSEMIIRERR